LIEYDKEHLVLAEQPYTSIQGEGTNVGCPMTYVRCQGCDVGCSWCDSYYTWKPFNESRVPGGIKTVEPLVVAHDKLERILMDEGAAHVWFTGGEPTLQADGICRFLELFKDDTKIYHICTAGWIWHEGLYDRLDCITIDIKAPTSGTKSNFKVIDRLSQDELYDYKTEFKIVVANNEKDRQFARNIVDDYPEMEVTLQPLYVSEPALAQHPLVIQPVDKMIGWTLPQFADWINDNFRHTPMVRMGLQLHKHIWPEKMRMI